MHGIEVLLATAEQLATMADCLSDVANSVVEKTRNPLGPQGRAGPSVSSSLL
jgi:hypothetical protein